MQDIQFDEAQMVGGGGVGGWLASRFFTLGAKYAYDAVMAGQVDYAGLAETQGHYYNTVGA